MSDTADQHVRNELPLLLKVRMGAARYGLPPATLYEWAAGGKVPGFLRQGRSVLIHRPTFEAWLRERASETRDADR